MALPETLAMLFGELSSALGVSSWTFDLSAIDAIGQSDLIDQPDQIAWTLRKLQALHAQVLNQTSKSAVLNLMGDILRNVDPEMGPLAAQCPKTGRGAVLAINTAVLEVASLGMPGQDLVLA